MGRRKGIPYDDQNYTVISICGFRRGCLTLAAAAALAESHAAVWRNAGRPGVKVQIIYNPTGEEVDSTGRTIVT